MASKAVVDAVEARLAAQWAECPVIGVNLQGEAPNDGSPFLVVQYPVANVSRPPMNQRYYREDGAFRLVIHTERGQGVATGLEWADQLAAIFRDQKFNGVITEVPSSSFVDDSNDRGNFFVTSIVCPYTFNFEDA